MILMAAGVEFSDDKDNYNCGDNNDNNVIDDNGDNDDNDDNGDHDGDCAGCAE